MKLGGLYHILKDFKPIYHFKCAEIKNKTLYYYKIDKITYNNGWTGSSKIKYIPSAYKNYLAVMDE